MFDQRFKRIEALETLVRELRRELDEMARTQRRMGEQLRYVQQMSVPIVREGKKVVPNRSGSFPGAYRAHVKDISITSAIVMLAEKVGAELVYHDDVPGEVQAVNTNEYENAD